MIKLDKAGRIAEATEDDLFEVYLKCGLDEVFAFPDYVKGVKKQGVKLVRPEDVPEIMLSVHPYWAALILSGHKTVEVRKSVPKTETPYMALIYETVSGGGRGKVVGVAVVKEIKILDECDDETLAETCLSRDHLTAYKGNAKHVYGMCLSCVDELDEPRDISDYGLTRPPQSWGYVSEVWR